MALMFTLITIGFASILGPLVYVIFKFTMKEKTFEEVIAEQRKQLALEHNLIKNKAKYQQTKKYKNVVKERYHADKRNKTISSHVILKDSKKVETSKINVISNSEKIDTISISGKRKNEKFISKNFIPNTSVIKTTTENGENSYDRSNNNSSISSSSSSNSNSCKKNVNNCSNILGENINNNEKVFRTINKNEIENYNSKIVNNDSYAGNDIEENKGNFSSRNCKTSVQNIVVQLQSIDMNQKSKLSLSDAQEKVRESKKQFMKQENDDTNNKNNVKSFHKIEEKTTKDIKSYRHKMDDKLIKPEEKIKKLDENKMEEKLLQSPSKNKKVNENLWNKNGDVDVLDEFKSKYDCKKIENESVTIPSDSSIEKENVNLPNKSEKQMLNGVVMKKQNSNGNVVVNEKFSPIQNGKGQKQTNVIKINKRQNNEIKSWQKMTNENNGPVNVNLLMPLIAKAELSRSEIQNLIDLLLNKQQENCVIETEWIEGGRQDPIVKLKKQLAEKEKALSDEQEAHQAIQSKLKELRTELNIEKHNNRQLEETLSNRQSELQAISARLQAISDEKLGFTQQMQQMQNKLNEERIIVRTLKEENSKTKNNLQQELLSQRQQLEMHIAHINEQHQQEVLSLETQLGQLASQLQEQEATNAQMNEEIRECVLLRERLVHQENQIAHLQQTVIQLEELRPIKAELERHLASNQYEVTRLGNELKSLTDQLNRRNAEVDKFNCTVQNMKIENQELMKENSRNNEQIKFIYNEKAQLELENEKLNNDLKIFQEQCRKMSDFEKLENDLKSYQNTVTEKNVELIRLNRRVVELEESNEKYISRNTILEEQNKVVDEIKDNLQKQLKKNDDLRCKNWKAMEALTNMEKTLENKLKGMQFKPHEIKINERKEILRRIKLVLSDTSSTTLTSTLVDDNAWFNYIEKLLSEIRRNCSIERQSQVKLHPEENVIKKEGNVLMLDELEKQNKQLQTMVSHYKSIISDTEGMLNSLQNHVEQEENRWSEQVQILQAELSAITEERNSLLLKTKIQNGCNENNSNCEQKVNGNNKCSALLAASAIKQSTVTS